MPETPEPPITAPTAHAAGDADVPAASARRRCSRAVRAALTAALAAAMLALGVAVGAAIGPAPTPPSRATLRRWSPKLLAAAAPQRAARATQPAAQRTAGPAEPTPPAASDADATTPARSAPPSAAPPTLASTPEAATDDDDSDEHDATAKSKLPADHQRVADPARRAELRRSARPAGRRPLHRRPAIPAGTLLSGWSALEGSAFASEAALRRSPSEAPPPIVHTIVQPPCPEGAAGRSLRARPPGALTAADEFLQATLPPITATAAYREHGLVVVTFATVGIGHRNRAAGRRLDAPRSPPSRPAGVLLISPFATAGAQRPPTRLQPNFTQAEPRKAPAPMTRPQPTNGDPRCTHYHTRPPQAPRCWLAAIVGSARPAARDSGRWASAEESNPNNYNCLGSIKAGTPEAGSEEQQVQYSFYCDGPITGYQLQAQIPVTGVAEPAADHRNATKARRCRTRSPAPAKSPATRSTASAPTKAGYETITGQFAIGTKLCAEPRVDPLLTVTYALSRKGRRHAGDLRVRSTSAARSGCKPDAYSGGDRLNPKPPVIKKHKKHKAKKSRARRPQEGGPQELTPEARRGLGRTAAAGRRRPGGARRA